MKHLPQPRVVIASLATVVLGLALVACASSDTPSGDSTGGSDESVVVKIANFGALPNSLPLALSVENSIGTDVELELLPPIYDSSAQLNQVITNEAQFAYLGGTAVASAQAAGKDVVLIADGARGFPMEVAYTLDTAAALEADGVTEDSDLDDRVDALKGLTLGIPPVGSSTYAVFTYMLSEYDIDPATDLTLVPLADTAGQIAALKQGQVDALIGSTGGGPTFAEAEGFADTWSFIDGNETLETYSFNSYAVSRTYLEENPEIVRAVLQLLDDARKALVAGLPEDEAVAMKNIVAPDMDQSVYDTVVDGLLPRFDGPLAISEAEWNNVVAIANVSASAPFEVPFSQGVDNAIAKEIDG